MNELRKMIETQRANDVLSKHGNGEEVESYTLADAIESDAQLSVALLVMKAKILKAGGSVVGLEAVDDAVAAGQDSGENTKP